MTPAEVQRRMYELELHGQEWDGEQFLAWLLGFAADEEFAEALDVESRRATILAENHYQRVTQRVAVLNPKLIAQVGFIQGATFAAAALGRLPWPHPFDPRRRDGDYGPAECPICGSMGARAWMLDHMEDEHAAELAELRGRG